MGFLRFRRTLRIGPGLRLNLSKSGVSASVGTRGAWFTIGPRGTRETVGIPGTGLSYIEQQRIGAASPTNVEQTTDPAPIADDSPPAAAAVDAADGPSAAPRVLFWLALLVVAVAVTIWAIPQIVGP